MIDLFTYTPQNYQRTNVFLWLKLKIYYNGGTNLLKDQFIG